MREIMVKLYQFEELSDKAKEKAREWYRNTSLMDDWWQFVYEDAENVGIKITEFDIDRGNMIDGEYIETPLEVIDRVRKNHGEHCDTYKTVTNYKHSHDLLPLDEDKNIQEEELENWEHELLHDLLEDYLVMLRHEYEYQTSDECVDENIMANEYEFTEDGQRA